MRMQKARLPLSNIVAAPPWRECYDMLPSLFSTPCIFNHLSFLVSNGIKSIATIACCIWSNESKSQVLLLPFKNRHSQFISRSVTSFCTTLCGALILFRRCNPLLLPSVASSQSHPHSDRELHAHQPVTVHPRSALFIPCFCSTTGHPLASVLPSTPPHQY